MIALKSMCFNEPMQTQALENLKKPLWWAKARVNPSTNPGHSNLLLFCCFDWSSILLLSILCPPWSSFSPSSSHFQPTQHSPALSLYACSSPLLLVSLQTLLPLLPFSLHSPLPTALIEQNMVFTWHLLSVHSAEPCMGHCHSVFFLTWPAPHNPKTTMVQRQGLSAHGNHSIYPLPRLFSWFHLSLASFMSPEQRLWGVSGAGQLWVPAEVQSQLSPAHSSQHCPPQGWGHQAGHH